MFTIYYCMEDEDFIKREIKKLEEYLFLAFQIVENLEATDWDLLKLLSEIEDIYRKVTDITFEHHED